MTLTVGSLFSGVGGLELGLERAGMKVVWQVEKDAFCRRVLAKHWPNVPKYEDVKDVGKENLAPADLICGGFPCQDVSTAGKKLGITGERSGLWSEYARIVGELRPQYVLVENVAALLHDGLGTVLGDLAELGYDAEWSVVPACAVGAPHSRERLFLLAYPRGESSALRLSTRHGATDARRYSSAPNGNALRNKPQMGPATVGRNGADWQAVSEPDVPRMVDGLPAELDAIRALGNAVVPQVAELIGRWIVEADSQVAA